ncbi:hypothetical protein BDY24DRAFT_390345 [Mrakia frigida]|uniref:uncharacterized protein n=1 Tax=Mrakia frigida TaxID=29902 RepID=UPI003FCBF6FF
MEPVASSSTSKALLLPRIKKSSPAPSAAGRFATSRFLTKPSRNPVVSSPRKPSQKRSFLGTLAGNQDTGTGYDWVDQASLVDLKGKGKATEADKPYDVPSRFMSASTSSKPPTLSSSSSTKLPNPSLRSSATSSSRSKPLKPRPPPSTTASRPPKPKTTSHLPHIPPSPLESTRSAATTSARRPGAGGAKKSSSKLSDTSSLGSTKGGSVLGQSVRGNPPLIKSTVATVAEEEASSKPLSWLDLAHSLGSITIPPPSSNPTLHTYAEFLFLLLGQVKLTKVLDESTRSVDGILNEAKESLAKAEEEVREEVERERLGKEIELLDSLLDPKIGHRLIPLLFELHQAQQTYNSLLLNVSSDFPPSHHHTLPIIKFLDHTFANSLTALSALPSVPGSPLNNVLSQLIARTEDKLAVLRKVKEVVEGRRDVLRKKVWEESLRRVVE